MKILAAVILALGLAGPAVAETCHHTGEEASGLNKICYYDCSFGQTTRNIGVAQLCPLTTQQSLAGAERSKEGGACFKQGEHDTGSTKQCIYDCPAGRKVLTIGVAQLCPLTTR